MGANPSSHQSGDEYPVENVSWIQATQFCFKLTQMDSKPPPGPKGQYTLPTAEQWGKYSTGADLKSAVYGAAQPAPVGSKGPANAAELYDVLGNVREWLQGGDETNKLHIGGGYKSFAAMGGVQRFRTPEGLKLDLVSEDLGFRVIWIPGR